MNRNRITLLLVLFMVWATVAEAQTRATGRPRFGSFFEGEIDAINLYNGNVLLDIPLFTLPGRELSTGLRLSYNSQKWDTTGPFAGSYSGGWRVNDGIGEAPLFEVSSYNCYQINEYTILLAYTISGLWVDGYGTKHQYGSAYHELPFEGWDCNWGWPFDPYGNLFLYAADGDGSWLTTAGDSTQPVLHFVDGTVIEFGPAPTVRTSNGNYLTRGANGLPVQDTLGRVIQFQTNRTVPLPPNHYKKYTMRNANGQDQTYTLNFWNGMPVFNPVFQQWTTLNDVLTSIELPDGRAYVFTYSNTQGYLTEIRMPTQATISYTYPNDSLQWSVLGDKVLTRVVNDGSTQSMWQFALSTNQPWQPRDMTVIYPLGNAIVHRFDGAGLEYETNWQMLPGPGYPSQQKVQTAWACSYCSYYDTWGPRPVYVYTSRDNQTRLTYFVWQQVAGGYPKVQQQWDYDWYSAGTSNPALLSRTNSIWTPIDPSLTQSLVLRLDRQELGGVNPANGQFELQGVTEYFYDQFGLTPTVNVPNKGAPASFRGNFTTVRRYSSAASSVEDRYEYDDLGNVRRHIDPLNQEELFSYADNFSDGINRNTYAYRTQTANALNHAASTRYHWETGLVTHTTDVRNQQTSYVYDALNRQSQMSHPNGLVQSWSYDTAAGRVTASTNSGAGIETYVDTLGRPIKTVTIDSTAGNVQVQTEYDANGRIKRVSDPYRTGAPAWNTTSYDFLDRVVLVTGPEGNTVSQNTYSGNMRSDGTKTYTYDGLGRAKQIGPAQYSYYVFGSLYSMSASGQTRTFTYDWLGRQLSAAVPEATYPTTLQYNGAGLLTSRTDPRGAVANYTYDAIGRPTGISYPGSTTPTVTYAYDAPGYKGLLTSMTDGVGSVSFGYNAAGQLTSEARTFADVPSVTLTALYAYDVEGKLTSLTYPSGRVLSYTYQPGTDRLHTVQNQPTNTALVTSVSDNPSGMITNRTFGNGVAQTRTFNGQHRVANLQATKGATTLLDLSYEYAGGRIQTRTDTVQPEHSASYSYDSFQRLASVAGTTSTWGINWQFDAWGNRTSQVPSGLVANKVGTQSSAYSNNHNVGSTYDAAGNLTYDNQLHYYYDAESQLVQIDADIHYAYDGNGRRAKKTVSAPANVSTYYIYGQLGLLSEFSTGDAIPATTASTAEDRLRYRLSDTTGTAVLLLDSSGNVLENNRVLPYGEPWSDPGTAPILEQSFTTYLRDGESGLDYALARYYASRSGRFTTPDPVGGKVEDPQSWNAYLYTANDPVNRVDPEGLDFILCDERRNCIDGYSDIDFFRNFTMAGNIMLIPAANGVGLIFTASGFIGTFRYTDPRTLSQIRVEGFIEDMDRRADASIHFLEIAAGGSAVAGVAAGLAPAVGAMANQAALGPSAGRVFYQYVRWNSAAAAGGHLIEHSPAGRFLQRAQDSLPPAAKEQAWNLLSHFWASGASGTVQIFAGQPNSTSVLWRTELPILYQNVNVVFRLFR